MKRYLVFAGYSYYADGGYFDSVGSYASLKAASAAGKKAADACSMGWYHVVDIKTGKVVDKQLGEHCGKPGYTWGERNK